MSIEILLFYYNPFIKYEEVDHPPLHDIIIDLFNKYYQIDIIKELNLNKEDFYKIDLEYKLNKYKFCTCEYQPLINKIKEINNYKNINDNFEEDNITLNKNETDKNIFCYYFKIIKIKQEILPYFDILLNSNLLENARYNNIIYIDKYENGDLYIVIDLLKYNEDLIYKYKSNYNEIITHYINSPFKVCKVLE